MISRQREWQLKRKADHLCITCGAPAAPSSRSPSGFKVKCAVHHKQEMDNQRKRLARKRSESSPGT